MYPRRIGLHYKQVDLIELIRWLRANGLEHKFIPNYPSGDPDVNLLFFIEVYDARAETALRIKWKTE